MSTTGPALLSVSPPAAPEISEKLAFIEEMTTNVDAVQERVLAEILARNGDSEYLAVRCGLAGAGDRATFRAKVPLVTYEDLKPYIMRVANGDTSPVLTGSAHPISEFLFTSGTSAGEPKLVPTVQDEFARRLPFQSLFIPVMSQFVPELGDKGSRSLYFLFVRSETTTPGGLPARSIQTSYYKSSYFKHAAGDAYRACTSPTAAVLCEDMAQSMYAQMVCGLCLRRDVALVGAVFATGLLRAIHFLQRHWEQLAEDIDAGELGAGGAGGVVVVSDPAVRDAVAAVLRGRPDPELAQFIRAECGRGDWAGIIARIWPNARCIETIATGAMAQYVPALSFYSGGLPLASTKYVASECSFGLNLRPMCDPSEVSYTIMPTMAYFEFLPVAVDAAADEATAPASELVELAGVELGREYEVVVTTYGGLNRYRVGDVLRVTGFHNAAPQFRFVGRRRALLSVDGDKTDEAELQRAVERASALLLRRRGAAVLDYTSRACADTIPGHYVVYWELLDVDTARRRTTVDDGDGDDGEVLARCCLEMEEALNYIYRMFRVVDGSIGPLEIRVVRPGTFEELADFAVAHGGASIGQYKVPRCVTTAPAAIVQLLDSRVVSSHFSPALPHWAPAQRFESAHKEKCNVESDKEKC